MEKINLLAKTVAIFSLIAVILFFGLLEHHRSFDPYSWLDPKDVSVQSRDLWNQRKELYAYFLLGSFASLIVSATYLFFGWIVKRNNRINLK